MNSCDYVIKDHRATHDLAWLFGISASTREILPPSSDMLIEPSINIHGVQAVRIVRDQDTHLLPW